MLQYVAARNAFLRRQPAESELEGHCTRQCIAASSRPVVGKGDLAAVKAPGVGERAFLQCPNSVPSTRCRRGVRRRVRR